MRLINAHALANYANNQIVGITANDIMRFPTVDAEPVKHGRWTPHRADDYKCSICGFENDHTPPCCEHCGAKMDGGTDDD